MIANKVHEIMVDCLYRSKEVDGKNTPEGAIIAKGITASFAFHPERLKNNTPAIIEIINLIPEQFFESTGGGWSFLNLCMDKDWKQWGEHKDCEALMVLAMAIGHCQYLMPRDMWDILPGGMPYIVFKDKNKEAL